KQHLPPRLPLSPPAITSPSPNPRPGVSPIGEEFPKFGGVGVFPAHLLPSFPNLQTAPLFHRPPPPAPIHRSLLSPGISSRTWGGSPRFIFWGGGPPAPFPALSIPETRRSSTSPPPQIFCHPSAIASPSQIQARGYLQLWGERGCPPKFFVGGFPLSFFPHSQPQNGSAIASLIPNPTSGYLKLGGGGNLPNFWGVVSALSPYLPPKNGVSLSPRPRTHLGGSAAREGPGALRRAPGVAPGVPPGSGLRGARAGGAPRAPGGRGAGNRKAPSSHSPPDAPLGKKAGKKRWEKWGGNLGKTGIWARGAPRGEKEKGRAPAGTPPNRPVLSEGRGDCANCPNCWGLSRVEAAPHPSPAMDWFHCSRCFRQDGARFAITNCGHILCEGCGGTDPCPVCGAACRYLPLSEQMRPQEKVFFKNPAAIALKHLDQITQVWRFQTAQVQLLLDLHRDRAQRAQAELEKAREELRERTRELESLRRENEELRRMQISSQLSPAWHWSSRTSTPRPSPTQSVTPQPRRRQLSSQVVSRLPPLEPPQSRSTLGWQVGIAYRNSGTPLASGMVSPLAGTSEGQGSALRLARGGRSQWDLNPRP
uniref:RING-type domain-containing protein n=1 Tax=Taeniopygia guttata TaxID=59729 RepID=A0A674HRC6_TAEGU